MSDNPKVRLVSAGTGKSIELSDNMTVADLRSLAGLSDDVQLAFNGDIVHDEASQELSNGDTVAAVPSKVGHGS